MKALITAIAKAVEAGMHVWALHLKSADKKRARACIENAEKYIFANERVGEFENVSIKQQNTLLKRFRHRFFKYNQ